MFESVMWQYIRQQQDVLLQVMKDEKIKEVAEKISKEISKHLFLSW